MVDKVDRPNVRSAYEISRPKETKEDQHQQQDQKEEMEKRYQKELEGEQEEWSKFGSRTIVIKPKHIPAERIANILFRTVKLHKGIATAQIDVVWKDGRQTKDALFRLISIEHYLKVKKIKPGDPIPREYWENGDEIEIGIPQLISSSGSFNLKKKERPIIPDLHKNNNKLLKTLGLIDSRTNKISWGMVFLYTFFLLLILIAIIYELEI